MTPTTRVRPRVFGLDQEDENKPAFNAAPLRTEKDFRERAAEVYAEYAKAYKKRFKWLRPALFIPQLAKDLRADIKALLPVLKKCGDWEPDRDAKLKKLLDLLTKTHPDEKVLIFTQFADTACYLEPHIRNAGVGRLACVTGDTDDPTGYAWRFSPESNNKRQQVSPAQELRVIVATDVLSEGQNLQDAAIVVNYDLPWAIIRLVQRAGRVDRIGQKAETILCYSFLPADGVERILRLRTRVRQRLQENAEVVGTDEHFFEDDHGEQTIRDLFTEKSGILDDDPDSEVDLSSYAYQIWKNAIDRDPSLEKAIPALPEVVYSTKRPHAPDLRASRRRECWSMSAPARATTHWPGRTARAERHRVAVCHSQDGRVPAGHPGTAPLGKPPQLGLPGRAAHRHGREIRWRSAWPAIGRPLPHLPTPGSLHQGGERHDLG